jgi:hypothetical protein
VVRWAFRPCGPIERLVTASWFADAVFVSPTPSFIIAIVLPQRAHALALLLHPACR